MLIKNIFITYMIIISFFYLTSSILWGKISNRIAVNLKSQEIIIGIILSILTVILLYFPIVTDSGANVQIKILTTVIAAVFFSSTTLITICICNVVWFYFIIGFNCTFIVDFASILFILAIGFWMIQKNLNEKKRIVILIPLAVIFKIYGYYVLDKWIYPSNGGSIETNILIHTIMYSILIFIPALLLSFQIANQTRNIQSKLKKLENIANIDGLTGLYNRRYFDKYLMQISSESIRSSKSMSLLMIDVDYFKNYNDFYGHPQGDECLKKISIILQSEVNSSGVCARYGGEEFTILLQNSTLLDSINLANRIINSVRKLGIEHAHSDKKIVTLSIGVAAQIASTDEDYYTLIKEADLALYKSKHNGRDQVSY